MYNNNNKNNTNTITFYFRMFFYIVLISITYNLMNDSPHILEKKKYLNIFKGIFL